MGFLRSAWVAAGFRLFTPLAMLLLCVPASAQLSTTDSQRQERVLFKGQQTIGPGRRWQVKFTSESNHRSARIAGHVHAQGGSGKVVRVLVLKGQSVVYDSGRLRSVVLRMDCSEPGRYTLIFDNSFSTSSAMVVSGEVSLVRDGEHGAAEHAAWIVE
ncbi:MAG: hypothetical protein WD733_15445 [Bryobacterales bacterium]